MLRAECDSGSPLGRAVQSLLARGELVGDGVMNELVARRLRQPDCYHGCILDGYPRTVTQARFLDYFLANWPCEPIVFDFLVSAEDVIARLGHRRQCPACGQITSVNADAVAPVLCSRDGHALVARADDQPAAIRERLHAYAENISGIVGYYRSRNYHAVRAARPADTVFAELSQLLNGRRPHGSAPYLRKLDKTASSAVL
jgi:adenylate kinase